MEFTCSFLLLLLLWVFFSAGIGSSMKAGVLGQFAVWVNATASDIIRE